MNGVLIALALCVPIAIGYGALDDWLTREQRRRWDEQDAQDALEESQAFM